MSYKTSETMINSQAAISYRKWGDYDGSPVYIFTLKNNAGAYVELTNYGATLVSAVVPDASGSLDNVVLGYSSLIDYVNDKCYLGSTIGRFANRIGGAKFNLDGVIYWLEANDGDNTNHGGFKGFNSKVFNYFIAEDSISFTCLSRDGDGGFPGNLTLTVTYQFSDDNELRIDFNAITDKKTVANFTNHAYFNLSAKSSGIFDHTIKVYADEILDVDAAYIPTGILKPAGDKALNGTTIRSKIMVNGDVVTGFNDCYLLQTDDETSHFPAAVLAENTSGRKLEVFTTYPSLMLYTGDYLNCEGNGNFNRPYKPFDGLCIECQYYPNSPNHASFPCTILEPGEEYRESIVYKFGVAE